MCLFLCPPGRAEETRKPVPGLSAVSGRSCPVVGGRPPADVSAAAVLAGTGAVLVPLHTRSALSPLILGSVRQMLCRNPAHQVPSRGAAMSPPSPSPGSSGAEVLPRLTQNSTFCPRAGGSSSACARAGTLR